MILWYLDNIMTLAILYGYGIIYACRLAVAVYGQVSEPVNICLGKMMQVLKFVSDKRGGTRSGISVHTHTEKQCRGYEARCRKDRLVSKRQYLCRRYSMLNADELNSGVFRISSTGGARGWRT